MPSEIQAVQGIDMSLIIAIAALILSIVSPLLSALLNGIFRIKEKNLDIQSAAAKYNQEYYEKHRAEVIENYIQSVSNVVKLKRADDEAAYMSSMSEVLLYLDEKHLKLTMKARLSVRYWVYAKSYHTMAFVKNTK